MTRSALAALDAAQSRKLLCVGDVMLDRYVRGAAARLSPEAPVPVLAGGRREDSPGGAANAAANAAAMGCVVTLAGVRGADGAGEDLARALSGQPGLTTRLVADPSRPTTLKTRFASGAQQLMRFDEESSAPVDGASEAALIEIIREEAADASAILLSDYAKGAVTPNILAALQDAAAAGVAILVDPKGSDFARYGSVELLKPNAAELSVAAGVPVDDDDGAARALSQVLTRCSAEAVLATRAEKGLSFMKRGQTPQHRHGRARSVFDVSGAGDTSLAALGVAWAGGGDLEACAELALAASGLAVERRGTSIVGRDELRAAMTSTTGASARVVATTSELLAEIAAWRQQGLTVGFTNGCFDVLHAGHVALLNFAREACDRLVVGLNSDASTARLKGAGRPIHVEGDRAAVLLALRTVDAVCIFDDDTPLALIEATRPDILVKGADYAEADIVGRDIVLAIGGRVLRAPLLDGRSTTAILSRSARGS